MAYLQITVAKSHGYCYADTNSLNKIVVNQSADTKPIFVFLCPDKESCEHLKMENLSNVGDANMDLCSMCVGYFEDTLCEFSNYDSVDLFQKATSYNTHYITRKKRKKVDAAT